ncbi:putative thioesterase [Tumebacillus algifaecis]|uniref:Putative thioesterase n=1 Tax=Tumebacillus algifaecis TaxID=1214604 RepID=A0A223CZ25_9BACL|nr:thioesterase II family protein [Tumebacillus algifaecis]ASS74689.1 putative thioesterase [Tumebacillus algifaecis]
MSTMRTTDKWIAHRKQKPNARLRLFCFPYAGGSAAIYRGWQEEFPAEVDVCSVQLPGRESRLMDEPYTRIEPMVKAIVEALKPHMDRPFAFFGHSMGALISFEVAREMRRQKVGLEPVHLFVSGRTAPQRKIERDPVHQLPHDQFIERLRTLNGTPEAILQNEELMELLTPVLRADFAVNETYVYQPEDPLRIPIHCYGGISDKDISEANHDAWREQTTEAFKLQMYQGDHFFLNQPESRQALLADLTSELKRIVNLL